MDHVSAREGLRPGVHGRRWRMREQARSHRPAQAPVADRYQTPEWLERSFVLPLTQPEGSPEGNNVPRQPVRRHDDDPAPEPRLMTGPHDAQPAAATTPAPRFVRPPSEDIDFARVIRRADVCRMVTRVHWAATGLAGLALVVYLLLASVVALVAVVAFAVVAVVSFVVRYRLNRAPVPLLER